jgi:hypothetical protein
VIPGTVPARRVASAGRVISSPHHIMTDGKRPGGLTALAIINFVFAAFGALGALGLIAMIALASSSAMQDSEESRAVVDAAKESGGIFLVSIVLTVLQSVLLLLSGIGYLQQKRFLGRTLGIVYALLAIGFAVLAAMAMPEEIGGGFALGTIVGLVYPVLTLLLLNVTFKHDFIR